MEQSFFEKVHKQDTHTPDVLSCLANLSNDEVFTPPELVNKVLDMLPQGLFRDPNVKFLDPATKTGVFLREIAKRLLVGLEPIYPDLQERIDHIFHEQLYGIAITELTSLLARRSLYCSKYPNGKYSICHFDNVEGNISFKKIPHTWKDGKCTFCGASQEVWERDKELETHAYGFIHCDEKHNKDFFERLKNMKFDVIIGNPPYQLGVGNDGGNSSKAKAIYQHFLDQAIKLSPRYTAMIIPSRWMTRTTEGISEEWVDQMLQENHFRIIHDFEDAGDCFPGVEIKGGVNYFLWEKEYNGKCDYYFHYKGNKKIEHRHDFLDSTASGVVIRDPRAYSILEKVQKKHPGYFNDMDHNFSGLVSPKDFFTNKQTLTSSWCGYKDKPTKEYSIKYYLNKNIHKIPFGWVKPYDISKNLESSRLHKVYIPAAGGSGNDSQVLGKPFYGEANSVCSQTYLVIGYDPSKHKFTRSECDNIIKYIRTRFFRYLVSIKKKTQNGPRGVYQFVPLQDFTQEWTDAKLYKKYGLTKEEITFIESMIKPMEEN